MSTEGHSTDQMHATDQTESATASDRWIVGIDLGTTNSALASSRPEAAAPLASLAPPQFVAPNEWATAAVLPSFVFFPPEAAAWRAPWATSKDDSPESAGVVGVGARDAGRLRPGRLVASSKSWLCHDGVDRSAALLPWHGEEDCPRISPVEAAAAVLSHLRRAWDAEHPSRPLAEQDVVITLPASFDEVARELTVRAAQKAGLPRVLLIEEPQAAFYAWMHRHADWADRVQPGDLVLVCDIGGGTSDFSLIAARPTSDGRLDFQRRAVGEHLLLGGDNLDAALAAALEPDWTAQHGALEASDYAALVRQCRVLKEQLFEPDCPEQLTLSLPARGRSLVAALRSLVVDRDRLRATLLEGFLPPVPRDARPETRRSGFQEFGLPFAADPAITRHLAAFLAAQGDGEPVRPDHVLFNGGFFAAAPLRERLVKVLMSWFADDGDWSLGVLDHDDLYQAVARGAVCYGRARLGLSAKIAAGLPRSFYIGVGEQAVCVAPAGLEPGEHVTLSEPRLSLTLAQPVEFPIFSSATRLDDAAGSLVAIDPQQLNALPPIRTVLRGRQTTGGETVVTLESEVSEIGTLALAARSVEDPAKRWRLQFDVRSVTQTDKVAHLGGGEAAGFVDEATTTAATHALAEFADGRLSPKRLMKQLEAAIALPRAEWPPTLLRDLWTAAIDGAGEPSTAMRQRPGVESRWLHLLGFSLRPGYGVALDDWRAGVTFKRLHGKLRQPASVDAARILWRRIGGGLTGGQQVAIAEPLLRQRRGTTFELEGQSVAEVWRLLASLERLPLRIRRPLADAAAEALDEPRELRDALLWSLARLLARVPTYGPLDRVLPPKVTGQLLDRLLAAKPARGTRQPLWELACVQAARLTGDRYRDLPAEQRERVATALEAAGTDDTLTRLLREGGTLPAEQQEMTLGDSLPPGLRLA